MISAPTKIESTLLHAFPRVECGFYPTPLEELVRLRQHFGKNCPRIFIKRDDYTGTGFGSNKLRKLDYAIAAELEKGTKIIITIAGEKSNHARVTAAVCAKFGLKCILVLNRAEKGVIPQGLICASRYLYELFGAEIHWVDSREEREFKALEILENLKSNGEKVSYIALGVSIPLGALGFVNAVNEVNEQFEGFEIQPNYIFHAGTSGGTQAGMIAGCQLFGLEKTNIIAVSPDDSAAEIADRVAEITNGIYQLLGKKNLNISPAEIKVLDEFIGAGYGIETTESKKAMSILATTEGVILDPTYTAKSMAALFNWIENGKLTAKDSVLFWHTGGQLASFYVPNGNKQEHKLIRSLNLADATSLVIGTIIGTGIFLKTSVMTQQVGSPEWVLLVWVAAGLLSLAGALSYAELGAMLPKAGGEYVYLREAYGDLPAFLYGWMRFAIGSTGSIAALGAGFAIFFVALLGINTPFHETTFKPFGIDFPWQFGWAQIVAVVTIMVFSLINCAEVVFGGRVQTTLTFAKVLGIAIIVIGVFLFTKGVAWESLASDLRVKDLSFLQAFGAAMLGALWAYDGWNNMPMAAGEIENPNRNIPRALIFGMAVVIVVYLLTNLAYFHALPIAEIATANENNPVATKAVSTFLGATGSTFVAIAIMISIIGALNGSILTSARVPYAMAEDGLFPKNQASLSKNSNVPVKAILVQAILSCLLALLGTFDQLTNYAVFAMWIFYILTTSAVFILRRKMPDAERPYKTLGYPLTPIIFILVGIWLLINTLQTSPLEAGIGLLLIALGIPIYFYFRRQIKTKDL